MITVSNLGMQFGGQWLFQHVDLQFLPGNCYGIIGANGAGKSTFLRILTGELDSTNGSVTIDPTKRVSVLKQNQNAYDDYTVMDTVIMGNAHLYEVMKEKDAIYEKPDFTDEDGLRAADLEAEFAELGGWEAESDASRLLQGLGIGTELHYEQMASVDPRLKVKILLAQALFGNPDIVMLDEPTNNLDIEAINWLEDFLLDFPGMVIAVSHDRHFLNTVCTHTVDIDYGKIKMYVGNYDFWYDASQLMQNLMKNQNKKNEEKADLEAFKANVDEQLGNDRISQSIAVKGYASPDGPVKFNDKLSQARSESGKKVVAKLLKDSGLDVDAAAYGEDWDGFKELVEKSDIKDKDLILQVLKMYNSPAEREAQIKNLSSVFNELKTEVLPELRRSQIINTSDIQGKTDAEIMAFVNNKQYDQLTNEELLYAAESLTDDVNVQIAVLEYTAKTYNDARAYNNLGIAQEKAGEKAAALKSFEKAAELGNTTPELNKNLVLANLSNGNTAEAKKYAQAADAQSKAALAAAQGDYKSAANGLEGYNAAIAQVMNNDLAGAKKSIAKDNSAEADYLRAVIAVKEGDLTAAEAQLKSAISKNPKLADKAAKDVNLKALAK